MALEFPRTRLLRSPQDIAPGRAAAAARPPPPQAWPQQLPVAPRRGAKNQAIVRAMPKKWTTGIYMGFIWDLYGIYIGFTWIYMGFIWIIYIYVCVDL